MLTGESVVLRQIERIDLPRLWELVEDFEVAVLASSGPVVPTSVARYEARFDRLSADPPRDVVWFAVDAEGELIGECGLHQIDHFNRRCELGIALGREHWGRGSVRTPFERSSTTPSPI